MSAVAMSAGSACHAGRDEPSAVLTAMGLPTADALCAIRISLGRWTTAHDIDEACAHIAGAAQRGTD
jgi:cysteine desulfurase